MKKPMIEFINREIKNFSSVYLTLVPQSNRQEAEILISQLKDNLNSVFEQRYFYVRHKTGLVGKFSSLKDVALDLNYSERTLECYISKGDGEADFNGVKVSIAPLEEVEVAPTDEGFWFRDLEGKVSKFDNLENAAKICKIKPKTLSVYLSSGKGKASTKMGVISTSPLRELTFTESFEQNYYLKHGYYPDPSEIPDEPRTNSQGRRY
jgi:hypothetical protein